MIDKKEKLTDKHVGAKSGAIVPREENKIPSVIDDPEKFCLYDIDLEKYVEFLPVDIGSLKELIDIMDVKDVNHLITLFDKISAHQTDLYKLELSTYLETMKAKKESYIDIIQSHRKCEEGKIESKRDAEIDIAKAKSDIRKDEVKKYFWYTMITINVLGFIASLFTGKLVEFFAVLVKIVSSLPK